MKNEITKKFDFIKIGKYSVSNKLFLDLVFNNKCNHNCKFCIARTKTYGKDDFEKWKRSLSKTLRVFKGYIESIIILGGESTIDPNFFAKLKHIDNETKDKHIFTILTTNGYMLKNEDFLQKVASSSIDSINISVMNYNHDINNYLMGANTLTRDDLKHIYDVFHSHGKTIRFNTNVAKNNLNSIEEMENYIKYFKGCFDAIKFTPLMKTDMFDTVDSVLQYTHEYAMSKEEIKELFDKFANKHIKNYHNSKVFGFINYADLTVFDEHVILKYEQIEDMYDLDTVIPTLKLYPNGNLSNEWDYKKNILNDFK
ncbi:MAG: radical SAM protein [Bacilli bacterium]|nr:radical SAM protein [Bacilli bacterium]